MSKAPSQYNVGDVVIVIEEKHEPVRVTITGLPGCSNCFPDHYKVEFEDGEEGLCPAEELTLETKLHRALR
jgi:hypothetical protein